MTIEVRKKQSWAIAVEENFGARYQRTDRFVVYYPGSEP